jgi:hypothetical protein
MLGTLLHLHTRDSTSAVCLAPRKVPGLTSSGDYSASAQGPQSIDSQTTDGPRTCNLTTLV